MGVTLSRWTMSYFAAALVCLLAAQGLMALGYGFPVDQLAAPQTLVVVHLVAIGWLSLLLCGALFQFVPVLVAHPIRSNALPLPTLGCLIVGLAALLLGFRQMAAPAAPDIPYFPAAAILLAAGFALAIGNLASTLWVARPLPLPARFVAVGLASLAATVALGVVFALVLGGVADAPALVIVTGAGLPLHVVAGLAGWLSFTAIGVSYRLLAMFMLAPELDGVIPRGVLWLGSAALAVAILGGLAAIAADIAPAAGLAAAGLLGLAALALYGHDIVHLYRARKRRIIELNSRMAAWALASLAATALLVVVLVGLDALDRHAGALVFLAAFGWLSGLGLAKLYKIVAFMTWLECYGPVIGKVATPRVQDLVVEARAAKWFWLYFAAVWCATASLLLEQASAFRIAAAAMAVATAGIVVQLVRTRRLLDVPAGRRLPGEARRPRLLLSSTQT